VTVLVLVVVTVVVWVVVLVEVLELVVVTETVVVVDPKLVLVIVVVMVVTVMVVLLVVVDEIVVVLVVMLEVVVVVPAGCIASHSPLMFDPDAAVQVSDWLVTVPTMMFQASNFSNAPDRSPEVQPVGGVQEGVPPWPMTPMSMSSGVEVVIVQAAGELAFAYEGSWAFGSYGCELAAPIIVTYITFTAEFPAP
jgi:hypothetical protein